MTSTYVDVKPSVTVSRSFTGSSTRSDICISTLTGTLLVAAAYGDSYTTVWEAAAGPDTTTVKRRFRSNGGKSHFLCVGVCIFSSLLAACIYAPTVEPRLFVWDLNTAQLPCLAATAKETTILRVSARIFVVVHKVGRFW
jgi:hypothetical protein